MRTLDLEFFSDVFATVGVQPSGCLLEYSLEAALYSAFLAAGISHADLPSPTPPSANGGPGFNESLPEKTAA
jgi:hypothetical protein